MKQIEEQLQSLSLQFQNYKNYSDDRILKLEKLVNDNIICNPLQEISYGRKFYIYGKYGPLKVYYYDNDKKFKGELSCSSYGHKKELSFVPIFQAIDIKKFQYSVQCKIVIINSPNHKRLEIMYNTTRAGTRVKVKEYTVNIIHNKEIIVYNGVSCFLYNIEQLTGKKYLIKII